MVIVKYPVNQDGWCRRAVNQDRSQEQQNRHREGGKVKEVQ